VTAPASSPAPRALSPATIKTFDQELATLLSRGFTPVLALRTIAALTRYVNGFVLQEQTEPRQDAKPSPDQPAALAQLPDGGAPATLIQALRDGGSLLSDQAFEHGLRVIIDGTAIALIHQQPGDSTPTSPH
jgi:TetR/AcrR family transcriptional regulator, tetracycline repressor protein